MDESSDQHLPRQRSTEASKTTRLSPADLADGVLSANPAVLARAVTLVESSNPHHQHQAQELLRLVLPYSGKSIRIGITGVPGAGKSTFIDVFGTMLCEQGHKVAVLAIDPSSSLSHGSILGDKTRMENLSRQPNCFIRPSPSGGTLGGVGRKTRESMFVCEAAGYDVIIVETVGVGQTEITVRSMVDFFLLLGITGAGDELQTFKKGIIELADLLVVNKADGDNVIQAAGLKCQFEQVLRYLTPYTKGWNIGALTCSSLSGEGISGIWQIITKFQKVMQASGELDRERKRQRLEWFNGLVEEKLRERFFNNSAVKTLIPELNQGVENQTLTAVMACEQLIAAYLEGK